MEIGTWKHRVGEVHFPAVVSFYTSIHRPNRLLFFSLLLVPFSPLLNVRFSFSTLSGAINKSWTNFIFKVSIINFFEFLNYLLVSLRSFYFMFYILFAVTLEPRFIRSNGSKWNIISPPSRVSLHSILFKNSFFVFTRACIRVGRTCANFIYRDLYTWVPRSRWIIFRKQCRVSRSILFFRHVGFFKTMDRRFQLPGEARSKMKIRRSRSKFIQYSESNPKIRYIDQTLIILKIDK